MRVAVVGATGNIGTSVLASLLPDPDVEQVTGIARRVPASSHPKLSWLARDVSRDDLRQALEGHDAVVCLAWLIQPARDQQKVEATNVQGSRRVFEAAADAGVRTIVYSSSVGTYAEGPKDRAVDETWPATGIPTSFYSRHKAAVESILDRFEERHPDIRVVRIRPGLVFKREAASEIRRLFIGPLLPSPLVRRQFIAVVPKMERLRFQAVHSLDLGDAFHRALRREVRGPYNVAAEPVLDGPTLGRILGARPVPVPPRALRAAADLTWRARLQPTPPGWVDMALGIPIMDTSRARAELGWEPERSAGDALLELIEGLRKRAGADTPTLDPGAGGPARSREFATGIGSREALG